MEEQPLSQDEVAPLSGGEPRSRPTRSRPRKVQMVVVGLAVCAGAAAALGVAALYETAAASNLAETPVELRVSNAPRGSRFDNVASDEVVEWTATHEDEAAPMFRATGGQEVEVTFTRVGAHRVEARRVAKGALAAFNVTCRYVRRELRDLTDFDRNAYFDAMEVVYTTEQELGVKLYGENFKSAAWLVREHLYGAADRECDHWHDDAGFLNHHVGITLQFESSLRSVNPEVCSHYWDYTIDAAESGDHFDYVESRIFRDEWFGSANPNRSDHAIAHGRWAFTHVMNAATSFSNVTNPYGLLRSPLNTNPTPYVTRSRYVLGVKDAFYTLPKCGAFQDYLTPTESDGAISLGEVMNALNGELHGPVHIMTGGHWHISDAIDAKMHAAAAADKEYSPDQMLLGSKFMWRQGYVRCPATCSTDTPESECTCSCPSSVIGERNSLDILNDVGFTTIYSLYDQQLIEGVGLDYDEILDMLCHVGHAGEMFTSAAPYDPLFWVLHGAAERFIQLVRLMSAKGLLTLDDSWSYDHSQNILSDTHTVCDWAGVDAEVGMPTCTKGVTCPGHKADDLLPFERVLGAKGDAYFTNADFWDAIEPSSNILPYVYDKLTTWPGCAGGTLLDITGHTDDGSHDRV
ncbi:hypothetical protein JL722_3290 [Aureococcus anophagefferens]|nr:hypothetical protein JL722_3290 [Aureococcus anophagefferens]